MKENGVFPDGMAVPVYIDGAGKIYNQTAAIMVMLAKQHGLYSSDPDMAYINDWALDTVADLTKSEFVFPHMKPSLTQDEINVQADKFKAFNKVVNEMFA